MPVNNFLQTAVSGILFGALAAAAFLTGFTAAGVTLILGGLVIMVWGDFGWGWVQKRMDRANNERMFQKSVVGLAAQHTQLLRVHTQLAEGMSELRDIIDEANMAEHTRRVLLASIYHTADKIQTILEEPDDG